MRATTANATIPAIEMQDVTVVSLKDPGATVLQNVNWKVAPGEFWVVAAPQHSGKSDFLMTVGSIMAPATGCYRFLGEEMPIFEEPRLQHRLKLGFVFDGGQLFGRLTVAENIALPLRYHGRLSPLEIEARVKMLLELTELAPLASNTPGNLGRSWQQRAGLARAIALQPEVLLLDSPLTGLDLPHQTWWLGFLDQLSRGHNCTGGNPITLIITADDLRPWRQHATQVACLAGKKFVPVGDWRAVEDSKIEIVGQLFPRTGVAVDPGARI